MCGEDNDEVSQELNPSYALAVDTRTHDEIPLPLLRLPGIHQPPGSDDICPICFWQDDAGSLRYASVADGPNKVSLIEAQRNFAACGGSEPRFLAQVRAPAAADQREPGWRPIDPKIDVLDSSYDAGFTPWPGDKTKLYYWRPDYWLRRQTR
jgi:hypothetical protein